MFFVAVLLSMCEKATEDVTESSFDPELGSHTMAEQYEQLLLVQLIDVTLTVPYGEAD